MIKYRLECKNCNLFFDSWFASSQEYEKLKKKKFLNCHNCNSNQVEKSLMAPKLINKDKLEKIDDSHKFKRINIVKPLPKIYCHGTRLGWSIYLTTNGPNDHNSPANNTTGTAIFSFLSSTITELLILIYFNYNKNEILYKKI